MWANLHLLFWLSLFPFVTGGWAKTIFLRSPPRSTARSCSWRRSPTTSCKRSSSPAHGPDSHLARALGADWKGKLSPILYATAIGASFISPIFANCIYIGVALMWLIPDRRLARAGCQARDGSLTRKNFWRIAGCWFKSSDAANCETCAPTRFG